MRRSGPSTTLGARRSWRSPARVRSPIRSWTIKLPTPTATAPRRRSPYADDVRPQQPSGRRHQLRRRADGVLRRFFIGGLTPLSRVFVGPGVIIDEPGSNAPVRVGISNAYYGAFFADTFEPDRPLARPPRAGLTLPRSTSTTRTAASSPATTITATSIPQPGSPTR